MGKPWEIVVGDVRRVLRGMPAESFDACLSDPPYGLRFMGNRWDYSVPSVNVWVELLRVLRPGAYAVVGIELDPRHAEKARLRISRGKIIQHAASKRR